jgi:hypothetical protein
VIPLLDAPMDLRRFEEMDTSKQGHLHEDAMADPTVSTMYQGAA